ncbi:MAG: SurA N-terminal domain-containing protein [Bacteroidota bacterium]
MSALSRIRHNMGLIVIVIFVALLAFILTDFFSGITSFVGAPTDAGTVAGQTVSYQEFQRRTSNASQGQGAMSEVQRAQLNDQVWNQMVNEVIFDQELKKVGLEISSAEIYDMFAGEEIAPFLRQYLVGPDQEYNQDQVRAILYSIINAPNPNPQQQQQLRDLEDFAIRYRGQERYLNMVKAGFVGSKALAVQKNQDINEKASISFLAVNFSQMNDSLVSVSDRDLANYIKENDHRYKQEEETFVRYARFQILPSAEDTANVLKDITKLRQTFAALQTPQEDSSFVVSQSRFLYSPSNFSPLYQVPENIRDQVYEADARGIIGPVLDGGSYRMYKVAATQAAVNASAKIKHILLTYTSDTNAVRSEAASIARQARGGADFATLASENSQDVGTKDNGGVIGWYPRGQFGEDFDEAIDKGGVGSIVGPIKGRGGFHVVQIMDKSTVDYNIATIDKPINYSSTTRKRVYGQANAFVQALRQTNDINQAASDQGVIAFESNGLNKNTSDVLGLNGGRELALWAIHSDIGEFSKVFDINDNFVVAQVTQKKEEGVKAVDDVRDEIMTAVRNKKKAELVLKTLNNFKGQDLNAMKASYGDGAFISTAENISFQSSNINGIGTDKFIIGKIFGMEPGDISEPIEGTAGVYVIQLTSFTEVPELDEATLATNSTQERTQGEFSMSQKVIPALTDMADVQDTRYQAEARGYGYK